MLQSVDTNPYIFTPVNDVVSVGCWQSGTFHVKCRGCHIERGCESMNGLGHSRLERCGTAFCWVGNGSE